MKRIFPLLLALAAAIFFVISLIFIEKEEQDPLLHAADIQNDISYEGKRASVLIKVPFYANTAAVTYNSGTDEYVFFPVWDCSEKNPSFILLGYRADDRSMYLSIKEMNEKLRKDLSGNDVSSIRGIPGYVLSGRLIRYDMLFDLYKSEAASQLSEYRDRAFTLPGVKEISGGKYYEKAELVLLADSADPVYESRHPILRKILLLLSPVILMGTAILITVKRVREEK